MISKTARGQQLSQQITTMTQTQNERARHFKSLHQPGKPLILTNVYDPPSARAVASLSSCKALATASYAVAEAAGLKDEELTIQENMRGIKLISGVAREFDLPLTADIQGGYGEQLESCIKDLIDLGVVGCNLEDVDEMTGKQYDKDTAANRVRRALKMAADCGVPDFVVNARVDTLLFDDEIEEAIARGNQYLAAGATTAFVWGGRKRGGTSRQEVIRLCEGLQGRLNVSMRIAPGNLTLEDRKSVV